MRPKTTSVTETLHLWRNSRNHQSETDLLIYCCLHCKRHRQGAATDTVLYNPGLLSFFFVTYFFFLLSFFLFRYVCLTLFLSERSQYHPCCGARGLFMCILWWSLWSQYFFFALVLFVQHFFIANTKLFLIPCCWRGLICGFWLSVPHS